MASVARRTGRRMPSTKKEAKQRGSHIVSGGELEKAIRVAARLKNPSRFLLGHGIRAGHLRRNDFGVHKLLQKNIGVGDLMKLGFTPAEIKTGYNAYFAPVKALYKGQWGGNWSEQLLLQLKKTNVSAKALLREWEFKPNMLIRCGYSQKEVTIAYRAVYKKLPPKRRLAA